MAHKIHLNYHSLLLKLISNLLFDALGCINFEMYVHSRSKVSCKFCYYFRQNYKKRLFTSDYEQTHFGRKNVMKGITKTMGIRLLGEF